MPDTPDLATEILNNRRDLAQQGHDLLDTIETSATAGRAADVQSAVDQIHTVLDTLADLLADIVIEPGLDDMARRLDQYAVELAENNEYDDARLVIETAEAFSRRHAQITSSASANATEHYHLTDAPWLNPERLNYLARNASRAAADVHQMRFTRR